MMDFISGLLIFITGALHIYFMLLEMVFWTRPLGMKIFKLSQDKARMTRELAMNQGLYNGFLAAGLFWSLLTEGNGVRIFFLVCVMLAGLLGALTVSKKILFVQFLPAFLALIFVFLRVE